MVNHHRRAAREFHPIAVERVQALALPKGGMANSDFEIAVFAPHDGRHDLDEDAWDHALYLLEEGNVIRRVTVLGAPRVVPFESTGRPGRPASALRDQGTRKALSSVAKLIVWEASMIAFWVDEFDNGRVTRREFLTQVEMRREEIMKAVAKAKKTVSLDAVRTELEHLGPKTREEVYSAVPWARVGGAEPGWPDRAAKAAPKRRQTPRERAVAMLIEAEHHGVSRTAMRKATFPGDSAGFEAMVADLLRSGAMAELDGKRSSPRGGRPTTIYVAVID